MDSVLCPRRADHPDFGTFWVQGSGLRVKGSRGLRRKAKALGFRSRHGQHKRAEASDRID
eukprot:435555-Rhodomonas_salina.1